ncbi:hypothetical protein TBR22_A28100 [Luteitalea sp. TBR-22]|uniref:hypothetical protein n=1 Tax=Luteitalea sp. TBR-22 TaxID=2802971 RepID=UPI001AF05DC7|nr:hypothetical protein [Luteitalea sp. TBR-22]BCS33583.1 hypothetical protein TBR22_A28100 [Luteitalea sp. TBR-22]
MQDTRHAPRRARLAGLWLALAVTLGLVVTSPSPRVLAHSRAQGSAALADRMHEKLESVVRFGAIPRLETQATVFEEAEVNAYLEHYLRSEIPPGIATPTLRILGDNRLSATATLDLDAMNASRPPSEGFDPLRVLKGSLLAKVSGRLVTENGGGHFELETAELGGIPLPRALVSQLLARYDVNLDAPFDLPSSIREIRVEPGQVTVLQ